MSRIATVEIEHKKTGRTKIINKKDYEPKGAHADWVIASERTASQMEANDAKKPEGDGGAETPSSPVDPDEDWRKMKWPQARQYVKGKTGTIPKSKVHAEELMAEA